MKNTKSSTHLKLTWKLNEKMPKIAKNTFQVHLIRVYYLHILGISFHTMVSENSPQ